MSPTALRLDSQLCFPIYAASRAIGQLYQPLLEPLGLTYPQYLVMLVLWEQDGLAVNEIGGRLFLDSGTLTPLLRRLEAAGLVKRARSREDERVVSVSLTAAGTRLRKQAERIPNDLACLIELKADEYARLHRELRSLFARVKNAASQPR